MHAPTGWLHVSRTTYDPVELELDRERIEALYQGHGYFSAKVIEAVVRAAGPHEVIVTFVVREGEPTRITAVDVADDDAGDDAVMTGGALRADDVFVYERYLAARTRLEARLIRRGYAFAHVRGDVDVDRAQHTAHVRLAIDRGPLVRFGRVTVTGRGRVPEATVLARLAWRAGEVFDPAKLEVTQGRLYQLGLFSGVRFDYPQEGRPAVADVTIALTEASRHELRLGGGFGVDSAHYEARARGAYLHRGFLDPLTTLRVDARLAYRFYLPNTGEATDAGFGASGAMRAEREDFLTPQLQLSAALFYDAVEREAYTILGPRAQLALARPLFGDRVHAAVSWQIGDQSFPDIADAIGAMDRTALGLADPYHTGFFEQRLAYDRRDSPVASRRGVYLELRLEEGGTYAGGAFDYVRVAPEGRFYVPFGGRVVMAARAHLASVLDGADTLPITRRSFAGGASSQRGFAYQHLAPFAMGADGDTVPIGGVALMESSVEARMNVLRLDGNWLGLVVFLDGADATRTTAELNATDLHWATGLGLRYQTPVGPLRADFGYRLNRTGVGEPDEGDPFAYHISLGEAF